MLPCVSFSFKYIRYNVNISILYNVNDIYCANNISFSSDKMRKKIADYRNNLISMSYKDVK